LIRYVDIPVEGPEAGAAAAFYLAVLSDPEGGDTYRKFIAAIDELISTRRTGRKLSRSGVRAINRATATIYEKRVPASTIALDACVKLTEHLTRNSGIRALAPEDSVRAAAMRHLIDLPKHNSLPNFWHHVWEPSKPVLHMGIGFMHSIHVTLEGAKPLVPLIARPVWLKAAVSNAQFHAIMLQKGIGELPLIELNQSAAKVRVDLRIMATRVPGLARIAKFKNPITRAMALWRLPKSKP
jgi:hypothetical protein